MPSRLGHYIGLCVFAGIVMVTNLGGPKLWDRDEPRNAGCAAEMLARHDCVVPSFNGELRTHKPVLLYWLMMSSYSVLGVHEFAARLPSALLAIGTVLCTYEMGRRLFSARVGLWAGIVLASTLLFAVAGRAATPDSTLIFCSTLAITIFVLTTFRPRITESSTPTPPEPRSPQTLLPTSWPTALLLYGAMGLGMLAKGPVGFVLPTAVIGLFLLIARRATESTAPPGRWWQRWIAVCGIFEPRHFLQTCWSMRPLTAIAASLAVAAPWYLLVGQRTDGEFLRGFFLDHNLGRAMQTLEGHRGNLFFYPLAILVGFFPWSVFTAPLAIETVSRVRRQDPWRNGFWLAISWMVVYVGVFSLAKTKLPSYITPCFPSLALLAGACLDRWLAGAAYVARGWQLAPFGVLALVGVTAAIAIPVAVRQTLPGEEWMGMIGLVPLTAGILGFFAMRVGNVQRAMQIFAGAAAAFLVLLLAWGADRVSQHQQYDRLWAMIPTSDAATRISAYGCLEPSWIFYGGRPIDEITHDAPATTRSPWIESHGRWVPKPQLELGDLRSGPGRPFVITTKHYLEHVRQQLPSHYEVLASVPYFLKKEHLVLLGPVNQVASRPRDAK